MTFEERIEWIKACEPELRDMDWNSDDSEPDEEEPEQ